MNKFERFLFRKVEVWLLLIVLLSGTLFTVTFGTLVRQELVGERKLGAVSEFALFLAEVPINLKRGFSDHDLRAFADRFSGQAGFSIGHAESDDRSGYLLISRYDGDLGRSIVELRALNNGDVVHKWLPAIDEINALSTLETPILNLKRDRNQKRNRLMHPVLFDDGSIVFQGTPSPLVKVDACSKLVWQQDAHLFHHSVEKDGTNNIWSPSHMIGGKLQANDPAFHDDAITEVSPSGKILFQRSVTELLMKKGYSHLLYGGDTYIQDPIHLNDIQPVETDSPYWKKGDVFLSLGHLNAVALYRPRTDEILWMGQHSLQHQHDVDILDDHRIAIFNNRKVMRVDGRSVAGNNEITVYDFETNEYSSPYKDALAKQDVRTISQGLFQVRANGNLFVEETNYGRTLEMTPDGDIVWQYVNRSSSGVLYTLNWSRVLTKKEANSAISSLRAINCKDDS